MPLQGKLPEILDAVAAHVSTVVGHSRVYTRTRSTRDPQKFQTLFVGGGAIDYWTVRRVSTVERHHSPSNRAHRTHTVVVEGIKAAEDQAQAGNSAEVTLQEQCEAIAEALRTDVTIGANAEYSSVSADRVDDLNMAAVAAYRGQVTVEILEGLAW